MYNNLYLIFLMYLLSAVLAASVLLAQEHTEMTHAQEQREILADTRLTVLCVLGSVCGGLLAVGLWPPTEEDNAGFCMRKLAVKFGTSLIAGGTLSPMIITGFTLPKSADFVLGTSTLIAMLSVACLHTLTPVILSTIDTVSKTWLKNKIK